MTRIIVLSYGIRRQTKRALDQARRFGHDIYLVPAIPLATRGLRSHRSGLVTVTEAVGRAGLQEALAGEDGVALLLHEDVLLHPDAAARLIEVAATNVIAVPRTNHTDVDGPAGELPGDVVQPLGPGSTPPRPIERARTVCLAAPAPRLIGLMPQRLTAANTRLFFPDRSAVLVEEAIATHLDMGPDQLEEPVGPDGRPLLVASMIVRDEEMFLGDCLQSLQGLVDRIDICDTGSTDNTVAIAKAAGAVVTEVEWRDDFAWARNMALEMSRDAHWVLQVDADERVRVADQPAFRRFLATALADGEGFDVPLRDVASDGTELGGQQLPRIFRGDQTVFHGRVHEVAQFLDGRPIQWAVTTELELEHHGYRPEVIAARDKQGRNLKLARQDHETAPTAITGLQLARSLPFGEERLGLVAKMYEDIVAGDKSLNEAGQVPVYQLYTHSLALDGRLDEAWRVISEGRALFPHVPVIRATYAEIGTQIGRHEEVVAAASEARQQSDVDGARPWADTKSEMIAMIETAKSQLAVDDVEAAGQTIRSLLDMQIPEVLGRWTEIASIAALSLGEDVVEVLLPHAAADATASCMAAIVDLMDGGDDAAAFVDAAIALADTPSKDQAAFAWRTVITADAPDAFASLVSSLNVDDESMGELVTAAGPRITARIRLDGSEVTPADLTAIQDQVSQLLAQLESGEEVDTDAAGATIAADPTGGSLERLAKGVSAAHAAPIAAAAVRGATSSEDDIKLAIILCTVADDAVAAASMASAAARLSGDALRLLRTRASDKGATDMAAFLTNLLLTQPV